MSEWSGNCCCSSEDCRRYGCAVRRNSGGLGGGGVLSTWHIERLTDAINRLADRLPPPPESQGDEG